MVEYHEKYDLYKQNLLRYTQQISCLNGICAIYDHAVQNHLELAIRPPTTGYLSWSQWYSPWYDSHQATIQAQQIAVAGGVQAVTKQQAGGGNIASGVIGRLIATLHLKTFQNYYFVYLKDRCKFYIL